MKNLMKTLNGIKIGLGALAFTAALAVLAGIHIREIANNYYIENPAKRYYDGRVLKMNKDKIDERIALGDDIMYPSSAVSAASIVGIVVINQYLKRKNNEGILI
jgi:hypothetical protein